MQYIIGWAVVIVSLVIAGIIVGRKFGLLANIDVDQVASEKARALKQQIIADRLRRRLSRWGFLIARFLKPISRLLRNGFDWIYNWLNAWQRSQVNREATINQEIGKRIETLLKEAEDLVSAERFDAAEKKYIEIIGLDPRNFEAFRELGDVYYRKQSFDEAKQTLEHALQLKHKADGPEQSEGGAKDTELAQIYYSLALIHEETGEYAKAITNLKRALKIEQNSPRYLDRLIEVSIMKKDKIAALDALKQLETANPENQKLEQFRTRIAEL